MRDYYSIAKVAVYRRNLIRNPQLKEELIQELVARIWEHDDGEMPENHLQYRANTTLLIDAIRAVLGRSGSKERKIAYMPNRAVSYLDDTFEQKEAAQRLYERIEGFSEVELMALEGAIEEKTMREVAKEYGCTEANMSMTLKRVKGMVEDIVWQ